MYFYKRIYVFLKACILHNFFAVTIYESILVQEKNYGTCGLFSADAFPLNSAAKNAKYIHSKHVHESNNCTMTRIILLHVVA